MSMHLRKGQSVSLAAMVKASNQTPRERVRSGLRRNDLRVLAVALKAA
ncbi:hypothetical protein ACFQ7W_05570 [Streptomyces niveus]